VTCSAGLFRVVAALSFWALVSLGRAEQMVVQPPFEVHYSALSSMFLLPEIASLHGLTRGPNIAILNIAVRKRENRGSTPHEAEVEGHFVNLLSQKNRLDFRTVREPGAIYYLASFRFTEAELLRFELAVELENQTIPVRFSQKFYVDEAR